MSANPEQELESEGLMDLTLKLAFFKSHKLLVWLLLTCESVEDDLMHCKSYGQRLQILERLRLSLRVLTAFLIHSDPIPERVAMLAPLPWDLKAFVEVVAQDFRSYWLHEQRPVANQENEAMASEDEDAQWLDPEWAMLKFHEHREEVSNSTACVGGDVKQVDETPTESPRSVRRRKIRLRNEARQQAEKDEAEEKRRTETLQASTTGNLNRFDSYASYGFDPTGNR